MKKSVLLFFVVFFSVSCSQHTFYRPVDAQRFEATSMESVKIYSQDINQNYDIIASVAADAVGSSDKAITVLKREAAKLGADAIINVKLTKINSFAQRTGVSGVAIKLK